MSAGPCWLTLSQAEVPHHDAWLGPREAQVLARLTVAKRRSDWRLGRFAAKEALRRWLTLDGEGLVDHERIEILAAEDGAPEAYRGATALPVSLSLSHSGDRALVLVAAREMAAGCDLEQVESRSPRFVTDYLTAEERAWVERQGQRATAVTVIWSAKESALKALRAGLTRDTREVVVQVVEGGQSAGWAPLWVRDTCSEVRLDGWWKAEGAMVLTMAATGPLPHPSTIDVSPSRRPR